MSTLFLLVTITDRRSTDAFLQLYESHGVNVSLRTVGSGTAVRAVQYYLRRLAAYYSDVPSRGRGRKIRCGHHAGR